MAGTGTHTLFVGVGCPLGVAATSATVAWTAGTGMLSLPITIPQTPQGFTTLQRTLLALEPIPNALLIVMEATGSYWMTLATTLAVAGFGISIINPAQAHYSAKAPGTLWVKRAKTDAIDAQTLARLAALLQPAPWPPPPAMYHELHQRLAECDQFVSIRQQVRNHLHALLYQPVVPWLLKQFARASPTRSPWGSHAVPCLTAKLRRVPRCQYEHAKQHARSDQHENGHVLARRFQQLVGPRLDMYHYNVTLEVVAYRDAVLQRRVLFQHTVALLHPILHAHPQVD